MTTVAGSATIPHLSGMDDTEPKPKDDEPPPEELPKEIGGAPGPEPTRYGDWQHKGRVTDF